MYDWLGNVRPNVQSTIQQLNESIRRKRRRIMFFYTIWTLLFLFRLLYQTQIDHQFFFFWYQNMMWRIHARDRHLLSLLFVFYINLYLISKYSCPFWNLSLLQTDINTHTHTHKFQVSLGFLNQVSRTIIWIQ